MGYVLHPTNHIQVFDRLSYGTCKPFFPTKASTVGKYLGYLRPRRAVGFLLLLAFLLAMTTRLCDEHYLGSGWFAVSSHNHMSKEDENEREVEEEEEGYHTVTRSS